MVARLSTFRSRNQSARLSQNIRTDKGCSVRVDDFRYLEKTLTKLTSIQEEIESRLKSENACYHSVQNLLSSSLLSKI